MNFLAHFVLATKLNKSPDFLAGSILPDIAKRAGFATPNFLITEFQSRNSELFSGIRFHLAADRFFHNSDLFKEGMAFWKLGLEEAKTGLSKTFFLHHLLFEMWLDKILMVQNPDAAIKMYETLNLLNIDELDRFSNAFYSDSEGKIKRIYQGFLERKFILAYPSNASFTEISEGVFCHVTRQVPKQGLYAQILEKVIEMENHQDYFLKLWKDFNLIFFKNQDQ